MDLIPSLCAGLAQAVVGHPIDTAKVLIQNRKTLQGLGIKDYYRGFKYPFIISLIFNGTVFPSYNYLNKRLNNSVLSGGICGLIVTPLIFTFENIKVLKQTNIPITKKKLLSFTGFSAASSREALAMGIYFSTYNYMKDMQYNSFIAGAVSGICNWGVTYPLDVIRNRQIVQRITFIDAYKQKKLYKGLGITLGRAILVNGSIFYTYDTTYNFINNC